MKIVCKNLLKIFLIILVIYTGIWLNYVGKTMYPYKEALNGMVRKTEEPYQYKVDYPQWPYLNGSIHIDEILCEAEDLVHISICFHIFREPDYIVEIWQASEHTYVEDGELIYEVEYNEILLEMDRDMSLKEPSKENVALYEKYQDKIQHVYSLLYEKWGAVLE